MVFEPIIGPEARWVLDRLPDADVQQIDRCINALSRNPYPPRELRAPLAAPGRPTDPDAFACGRWRISFRVVDNAFVVIERIGCAWPPAHRGCSTPAGIVTE